MPTSPSGSSKRNDPTGLRSALPSYHERVGSQASISSAWTGVRVALG